MQLISKELKRSLSSKCLPYEVVVVFEKHSDDLESLCSLLNQSNIEAQAIQVQNGAQPVLLVLGMKYTFNYKEAMCLLTSQPDKGLLLYKTIDYVSLYKAGQMQDRAHNIYRVYYEQEHNQKPLRDYDDLDEDQAHTMKLIDEFERDEIDEVQRQKDELLYGNSEVEEQLPY